MLCLEDFLATAPVPVVILGNRKELPLFLYIRIFVGGGRPAEHRHRIHKAQDFRPIRCISQCAPRGGRAGRRQGGPRSRSTGRGLGKYFNSGLLQARKDMLATSLESPPASGQ